MILTMAIEISSYWMWLVAIVGAASIQVLVLWLSGRIENKRWRRAGIFAVPLLLLSLAVYSWLACFYWMLPYPRMFHDTGFITLPDQYYGAIFFSVIFFSSLCGSICGKLVFRRKNEK